MGLLNDLMGQVLSGDNLNTLSKETGLDANTVRKIAGAGLPTILQGVLNNSANNANARELEQALLKHGQNYQRLGRNPYDYMRGANIQDGEKILGHVFGNSKASQMEDYLAKQTGANKKQTSSILGTLAPLALAMIGGKFIMDGGLNKILGKDDTSTTDQTTTSTSGNVGGFLGELASSAGQLFGGADTTQTSQPTTQTTTDSAGSISDYLPPINSVFSGEKHETNNALETGLTSLLGGGTTDSPKPVTETAKSTLAQDSDNDGIPDLLEGLQNLFK